MMTKIWRWLSLADLPKSAVHEHVTGAHNTMWFTMKSHSSRVEYSACCGAHLLESLKSMGYEGLK